MLMKKRWIYYIPIIFLIIIFIGGGSVIASEEDKEQIMDYVHIEPIFPKNQTDTSLSYFDLKVTPGEIEMIDVLLKNKSDKAVQVYMRPETAITSGTGKVVYRPDIPGVQYDESLIYPLTTLTHVVQNNILLEPYEEQIIQAVIEIPKEPFEGVILGGLRFSIDNEFMTHAVDLTKENIYDYILGIRLFEEPYKDPAQAVLKQIYPYYFHNQLGFQMEIQNNTPLPLVDVAIDATIYQEKSHKKVASLEKKDWHMAPNSNVFLNITLDDENDEIMPESYIAEVHISSDLGTWKLHQSFLVNKKRLHQLQLISGKRQPFYQKIPTYVWGLGIGIVIVIFVIIIMKKIKQKHKEKEHFKRRNRRKRPPTHKKIKQK